MKFLSAVHSDVGIRKSTNQDGLCLKIAQTPSDDVLLAVICDGMGGLEKGELASATIIRAMSEWFENNLPNILKKSYNFEAIKKEWETIINTQNDLLYQYGENHRLQLGTTLTALLIVDKTYIIVHVGDSRVYKITDVITILTEDQTVVSRDLKLGLITPEEAEKDSRQNVLLQCIGASKTVVPEYITGTVAKNNEFMLCSDGFRHMISSSEMLGVMSPNLMSNEAVMKKTLVDLTELNKSRQERDNISAILIKAV